jgi:hypothetical protein
LVRRKGPVAGVRQERLMRGEYGERVRVEKWPKWCMHMWINEQKINK